ncbi:MAG: hypothetical protein JNK58_03025 [Phycisphaerae bacterium]|nr:hypothetical protein [Phycisphaerae bacterium]
MTTQAPKPDEFYVGYLPLPWGHSRFLRIAVPVMLWLLLGVSIGIAWTQRGPGEAVWDDGVERTWTGLMRVSPYPMLQIDAGADAGSVALIVEQGKHGSRERCLPFDGARVRLRGWRLERDGRRIIELSPDVDAIEREGDQGSGGESARLESGEAITLRGEIMDAKCFLGAMKPGEGATHRSCAILCITGGIPAMLVTRDEHGAASYHLLVSQDGEGPMPTEFVQMVGEPVTVTGRRGWIGDLGVLLVDRGSVTRR